MKHPPENLFEFGTSLYFFYKEFEDKSCSNKLMKGFHRIYDLAPYDLDKPHEILRRFVNCFAKGYSNLQTEEIKVDKSNRKKRKKRPFQHT